MMPRGSPCRRGSRRPLARNVVLAALSLGCALVIVVAAHSTPHDPIYSVDQVYAGLWVHPSTWVGRTVRVRGVEISASDYRGNAWGQLLSTTWRPGMSTNDVISLVIVPQPRTRGWLACAAYRCPPSSVAPCRSRKPRITGNQPCTASPCMTRTRARPSPALALRALSSTRRHRAGEAPRQRAQERPRPGGAQHDRDHDR